MLLNAAHGGGGLAPPFLSLGLSEEEEDEDKLPPNMPSIDTAAPPSDDEGIFIYLFTVARGLAHTLK